MGARGEAGRQGDSVRSDVYVAVEPRDTGGIEIDLVSRVEPYYGAAIRQQAADVLARMGVAHAAVAIRDAGALPYCLAARIEAAALAAGLTGEAPPERTVAEEQRSARDRLRRSRLYLPGNEPKYFPNAGLYAPDGVILDLEDSVHPDHKTAARVLVRNALRCVDFKTSERMVRINQLPLGLEDLAMIAGERPDLVLIPKVESVDQVRQVAAAADGAWLMPILESALGIERAFEIAGADETVVALTIGLEDYAADLGVARSTDGGESAWARQRLLNAAKAAGVQAIDSVYGQVDDLVGLKLWGQRSRTMGYEGMGCLHPRQIPVIHEAFAPPRAQVERALKIVAAFRRAEREGLGVVSLGSKMIDPPVVQQAQRLVERARRAGLLDGETE